MRERRKRTRHDRAAGRVRLVPAGSLSSSLTTFEAQWMLLPSEPVSVADILRQAADCLQISSTANLQLRLDGALLKPDQPADLVRDGDSLTVLQIAKSQRRGAAARSSGTRRAGSDIASSSSSDESASSSSSCSSESSAGSSASSPVSASPVSRVDKSERTIRASAGGKSAADDSRNNEEKSVENRASPVAGTKRKISQTRRKKRNRRNRLREKRRKQKQNHLATDDEGEFVTKSCLGKATLTANEQNNVVQTERASQPKDLPVSDLNRNVQNNNMASPSESREISGNLGGITPVLENQTSLPEPASHGVHGHVSNTTLAQEDNARRVPAQAWALSCNVVPGTNGDSSTITPPAGNQGRVSSVSGVLLRLKRGEPVDEIADNSKRTKLTANGPGTGKPGNIRANENALSRTDQRFLTESQNNVSVILQTPIANGDTGGSGLGVNGYGGTVITTNFMSELERSLRTLGLTQVRCALRLVSLGHDGCPHVSDWIVVIVKPDATSESILIHRQVSRRAVDIIFAAGGQHLDLHPPDFPMAIDVTALHGLIVYESSAIVSPALPQPPEEPTELSLAQAAMLESRSDGDADQAAGRNHQSGLSALDSDQKSALGAQDERELMQPVTGEVQKACGPVQAKQQTDQSPVSIPVSQPEDIRKSAGFSAGFGDPKVLCAGQNGTVVASIARFMAIICARLEQLQNKA